MSDAPQSPVSTPESISKARRIAFAFQSVFGPASRRSSDQRIVIEHLRRCCGRDLPVFQVTAQGTFDPLRAAHIDGAQTQFLIIKRQLEIAGRSMEEKKPVKIKK